MQLFRTTTQLERMNRPTLTQAGNGAPRAEPDLLTDWVTDPAELASLEASLGRARRRRSTAHPGARLDPGGGRGLRGRQRSSGCAGPRSIGATACGGRARPARRPARAARARRDLEPARADGRGGRRSTGSPGAGAGVEPTSLVAGSAAAPRRIGPARRAPLLASSARPRLAAPQHRMSGDRARFELGGARVAAQLSATLGPETRAAGAPRRSAPSPATSIVRAPSRSIRCSTRR